MSNEIIKQDEQFITNANGIKESLSEELAGLNITFDRIKVPSGGGIAFEVPSDNADEPDLQKDISAVILYHHPVLSYYKEKYTGGNEAPDCSSSNGINGLERETGEYKSCKECPLNEFGSGENGGKACKTKRRIFLLRKGESLPVILSLPTGSISDFSKYIMRLVSKGKKSNQVVTKFSLKKAQNAGGIFFSRIVLNTEREVTLEEQASINLMTEQVKSIALNLQENYESEE